MDRGKEVESYDLDARLKAHPDLEGTFLSTRESSLSGHETKRENIPGVIVVQNGHSPRPEKLLTLGPAFSPPPRVSIPPLPRHGIARVNL